MNTALIGIDYIFDIIHPEGKSSRCAKQVIERNIVQKANELLSLGRQKEWLSILVKVGFASSYVDQPKHSKIFGKIHETGALALNMPGTEFPPNLKTQYADLVIVKPRISAFYGTNLDAVLRARRIQRLVIAGVSTSWAIQSTVRDAHDRDYEVWVAEEACAAVTYDEHKSSIELLGRIANIVSIEDLRKL